MMDNDVGWWTMQLMAIPDGDVLERLHADITTDSRKLVLKRYQEYYKIYITSVDFRLVPSWDE